MPLFSSRHRLTILAAFVGASESVLRTGPASVTAAGGSPREPAPVAIGSKSTPVTSYSPTYEPTHNPVSEWQDALDSAVARWRSLGISDYNYHFRSVGMWSDPRWVKVEVRDGAFSEGHLVSGEPDYGWAGRPYDGWMPTVEGMFNVIQYAIDHDESDFEDYYYYDNEPQQHVEELRVTYDPHYGYPTSVFIDYYRVEMDEEEAFEANSLEVIDPIEDSSAGNCCAGVEKCGQNPHKCKCINNKCKKKNKNCMTKGDDMESWGCRDGMTCVADDNEKGMPKLWGKCEIFKISVIQ